MSESKIHLLIDKAREWFFSQPVSEQMKLLVMGGLAYVGYTELPEFIHPLIRIAWGPAGIMFATTPSEGGAATLGIFGIAFPVNSQVAGLSMLAILGLGCMPWEDLGKEMQKDVSDVKESFTNINTVLIDYGDVMTQEEIEKAKWHQLNIASASLGTREQLRAATLEANLFVDLIVAEYGSGESGSGSPSGAR